MQFMTTGLTFPEGPVVCNDGSVLVCEIHAERVTRVKPNGEQQLIAKVAGGPNGMAFGPDGALYVCNNGGSVANYRSGSVDRVEIGTGKVERLYDRCDGELLAGPNDIVFDARGGMWFTDCGKRFADKELLGGLFYAQPDGSSIRKIVAGIALNGVGLSPDARMVYAAATYQRWMLAYDANPDGGLQAQGLLEGRIVGHYPGRRLLDSMAIEADGTIAQAICIEKPGISRLDPNTGTETTLEFPDPITTNIAFGGDDMRTAYITLAKTGRLVRMTWPAPGLRLNFNG